MSESLQDRWPEPGAPLDDHIDALREGRKIYESQLTLPKDDRLHVVYYLQATGRSKGGSALAMGDKGSGKSTFGKFLYGPDNMTDILATDTADSLYGHVNVVNAHQFIPGRAKGLVPGNPMFFGDEAPNLSNAAPLNNLSDRAVMLVNGQNVALDDLVSYFTGNYLDGSDRVKKLDPAFRSRRGVEIILGDNDEDQDTEIHGLNADEDKDFSMSPLLPNAGVRHMLHEAVKELYPAQDLGRYVVEVVNGLNQAGLVTPINRSDNRHSEALYQVARARMLLNEAKSGAEVTPYEAAHVMALVLPKVADLSPLGKSRLNEAAGRRTSPFEQAIAVRRAVARQAFATMIEMDALTEEERRVISNFGIENAIDKHTYADQSPTGIDMDQALYGGKKSTSTVSEEPSRGKSKRFGFRTRN